MENMNVNTINKEEDLFLALTYARLKKDLQIIMDSMEENAPKDYSAETNVFKKGFGTAIVNPVKRTQVRNLSEDKKKAIDHLEAFEEKYQKMYDIDFKELKDLCDEVFESDMYQEAKMMMAFRICLDTTYAFVNVNETLEIISLLLFGSNEKLLELYKELKNNYYRINKQDLRNVEKGILIGLGIATAATLLAGPIGLTAVAATHQNVASGLALLASAGAGAYGAGVAKVTTVFVASEILLTGATCGVLTAIEIRKNKELKKQFRDISSDDLALKLAIKATLIEEIKKNTKEEIVLSYIDDALHILDDYRSDAEYMMIVEKLDANNAKKKITICNNLSSRLAEIVGI